jgi:hypothetical protein
MVQGDAASVCGSCQGFRPTQACDEAQFQCLSRREIPAAYDLRRMLSRLTALPTTSSAKPSSSTLRPLSMSPMISSSGARQSRARVAEAERVPPCHLSSTRLPCRALRAFRFPTLSQGFFAGPRSRRGSFWRMEHYWRTCPRLTDRHPKLPVATSYFDIDNL